MIATTKDSNLLMDVRQLEAGHRILKQVLSEIFELRLKIEGLQLDRSIRGRVASFTATPEQQAQIAPYLIGLQELSAHLEGLLPRISDHAKKTASRLGPFLKASYRFDHFVILDFPEKKAGETDELGSN